MKRIIILFIMSVICILSIIVLLYLFNIIPHKKDEKKYKNEDFQIQTYKSKVDKDKDGIDDQTDFFQNVRAYIATKPIYKSKYYEFGYPDDKYGVCTDVIAFGLKDAGYDIRELLDEDVRKYRSKYDIDEVDKNIDFRRVSNLNVYMKQYFVTLTNDLYDIDEWQGGDIIVFEKHIGVISDKRNDKGVPYLIHHTDVQSDYEEDILETRNDIVAHYRIS